MTATKAVRKQQAVAARLLAQCEAALAFRFEVTGAPSITVHVEPDGMGHWAVLRYGWQQPMVLGVDGWLPVLEVELRDQYRWTVGEALERVPALLAAEAEAHAAWQKQHDQARRAARLAEVVEEFIDPIRTAVAEAESAVA